MDINALDKALQEIVKYRDELSKLDYNNPKYDDLEEKLHDLEDNFQDEYGDYLEGVLDTIHDKYCPDNDVLLPIAYLGAGISVEMEKFPGKDVRLMLTTSPPQFVLTFKDKQEVVWKG
jgi:uncharacterized protein YdcH (DUF465 family)